MKILMKLIKEFENKRHLTASNVTKLWILNKKFILIVFGIMLIISYLLTYILPHNYTSEASIIPPESSGSGGGLASYLQSISGGISLGGIGGDNKALLLTDYLQSREIAKYVYDSLKLKDNKFFKKYDSIAAYYVISSSINSKLNRSGLIWIRSEYKTPYFPNKEEKEFAAKMAADIANKAIEGLDYITRNKSVSKAKQKRIYIEKILEDKKKLLDSVDNRLKEFQKLNKVIALDDQAKTVIASSATIGTDLLKAEHELAMRQMELKPDAPEIKQLQESVNKLKNQYMRVQNGGIIGSSDYSVALSKVPDLAKEYTTIIRDKKMLEQVNAYLESQKYQEAIQEQSDMPAIEALDKALIPVSNDSPSTKMAMVIGGFVGLSFSMLWVLILNVYHKKFILNNSQKNEE